MAAPVKHEWTPQEDIAVMRGDVVKGISPSQCRQRRYFLTRNYVDVGWGDLIGKQKICYPQDLQVSRSKIKW